MSKELEKATPALEKQEESKELILEEGAGLIYRNQTGLKLILLPDNQCFIRP